MNDCPASGQTAPAIPPSLRLPEEFPAVIPIRQLAEWLSGESDGPKLWGVHDVLLQLDGITEGAPTRERAWRGGMVPAKAVHQGATGEIRWHVDTPSANTSAGRVQVHATRLEARGMWSRDVETWLKHHAQQATAGRRFLTKAQILKLPEFADKVFHNSSAHSVRSETILKEWPTWIEPHLKKIKEPAGRRFDPDALLRVMGELGYTTEADDHKNADVSPAPTSAAPFTWGTKR